jgi:hypothetical protein
LLEKDCAVCKEQFSLTPSDPDELVVITLPCKHPYHQDCILPWVKSSGTCPTCRYVLVHLYARLAQLKLSVMHLCHNLMGTMLLLRPREVVVLNHEQPQLPVRRLAIHDHRDHHNPSKRETDSSSSSWATFAAHSLTTPTMEPPIGRLMVAAPVEEVAMDLCQEDGLEESIEQIYECHRYRSSHAMLVVALCTFSLPYNNVISVRNSPPIL